MAFSSSSSSSSASAAAEAARPRKHVAFSTRFLPSEGIPAYNALLDTHLGKRREYLLGNKHSLQHLQRTGAIARVEEVAENASQYVVYMSESKAVDRAPTIRHELYGGPQPLSLATRLGSPVVRRSASLQQQTRSVTRSESTPQLALAAAEPKPRSRRRRRRSDERDEDHAEDSESAESADGADRKRGAKQRDAAADSASASEQSAASDRNRFSLAKSLGCGASTTLLETKSVRLASDTAASVAQLKAEAAAVFGRVVESSPSSLIDRLRRRRASQGEVDELASSQPRGSLARSTGQLATHQTPSNAKAKALPPSPSHERSVVERLLESDAAFQLKLQILKDEMRVLEGEKQFFDAQVARMRRRLRGVNAVHENDVAVAHCSAIMHARIAKAEEEYMKLVTAQQQVKTDIDALRRELLAMRKVTRKLEDDIADVAAANAAVDAKVRASKGVRNVLSQELVELERRAELEAEEQRLKLPPEEDVVVDAHELMSAAQLRPLASAAASTTTTTSSSSGRATRRSTVVLTSGSPLENLQRMLSDKAITAEIVASDKPLLPFRRAFRVVQQTLGLRGSTGDDDVLATFVGHFEETEDALLSKHKLNAQLQDEVDALERESATLAREAAARHAALRGTQHVTSAMHQELQDKIAHALQRIDTYNELRDVRNYEQTRLRAIMQKCLEILHAEKLVSSQESLGGPLLLSELSPPAMLEALQKKMTEVAITLKLHHNARSATGDDSEPKPAPVASGRARQSIAVRRSNVLLKRDVGLSKIVLGPREPSGAALTAILITAQPPTVEGAQILSETHAAGMHALHPSIVGPGTKPDVAPRRATITRMASIRAGKRASALISTGSNRRISAPATSSAEPPLPAANARPSRVSMVGWPLRTNSSSTDSLIAAEDADARVIHDADELDA